MKLSTSVGLETSPFLVVPSADDTARVGDWDSGEAVFCRGDTRSPWDSAPSIPTFKKVISVIYLLRHCKYIGKYTRIDHVYVKKDICDFRNICIIEGKCF